MYYCPPELLLTTLFLNLAGNRRTDNRLIAVASTDFTYNHSDDCVFSWGCAIGPEVDIIYDNLCSTFSFENIVLPFIWLEVNSGTTGKKQNTVPGIRLGIRFRGLRFRGHHT